MGAEIQFGSLVDMIPHNICEFAKFHKKTNIFYGLRKKEKIYLVNSLILSRFLTFSHTPHDKYIFPEMTL
jgi:hypothetical protein